MKPNTGSTVLVEGDFEGLESRDMSIRPEDFTHIASLVTDIYSDAAGAVVREYSANAWDSHVMAGNTAPIEVTTPNMLNTFFRVQDFGEGLNKHEIFEVYGQYGASNKRERDDAAGMFGIGSKSALSYTNSFTVYGVKDGWETSIMFERKNDGTGKMTLMNEGPTNKPNGVLVEVPVNDRADFQSRCNDFFRFWQPGTVLVNGKQPDHARMDFIGTGEIVWKDGAESRRGKVQLYATDSEARVVMGNVPYPVNLAWGAPKFVAHIPIGSVSITPSREALYYNNITDLTIEQIQTIFKALMVKAAYEDIDKANTWNEAWNRFEKWQGRVGRNLLQQFQFKGKTAPVQYTHTKTLIHFQPNAHYRKVSDTNMVALGELYSGVIIKGFKASSLSAQHKAKLKQYEENLSNKMANHYFFFDSVPNVEFFEGVRVIDWNVVSQIKLTPNSAATGSYNVKAIPGSWERYVDNGVYTSKKVEEITTLDSTAPIVYVSGSDPISGWHADHHDILDKLDADVQFLRMGKNRWDKFKKQFPQAMHVRDYVQKLADEAWDNLLPSERKRLTMDSHLITFLKNLSNSGTINDPAIAEWARVANIAKPNTDKLNNANYLCARYTRPGKRYDTSVYISTVFDNYPLVMDNSNPSGNDKYIHDALLYINSKYAESLDSA